MDDNPDINEEFELCYPQHALNREYLDALDEVHTRFVLNLPDSELETADRIFFQLEQAWWFYEDFICDAREDSETTPSQLQLPRFSTFKPFAEQLFCYSPLLPSKSQFAAMWNLFGKYKRKISNYGCILLNKDCTKIVLCQLWNSKTHTLPAGKINQNEDGMLAAARETYEETGFDPLVQFGLTNEWANGDAISASRIKWEYPLREQDCLVFQEDQGKGKRRIQYVVWPVPEDFPFEPVARKEVSNVQWHSIDNLPKPSFAVTPFLGQLRKWIKRNKKYRYQKLGITTSSRSKTPTNKSNNNKTPNRSRGRKGSRGRADSRANTTSSSRARSNTIYSVSDDGDELVKSGLAQVGDSSGWSEEDMFTTNERLIGRKIEYDGKLLYSTAAGCIMGRKVIHPYLPPLKTIVPLFAQLSRVLTTFFWRLGNPHVFSEKGFSTVSTESGQTAKIDPHAFRVVGGGFLNSNIQSLAPQPPTSKLQPLFRKDGDAGGGTGGGDTGGLELTPFFTDDGATPWGEVVHDVKGDSTPAHPTTDATGKKKTNNKKNKKQQQADEAAAAGVVNPGQLLLQQLHKQAGVKDVDDGTAPPTTKKVVGDAVFDSLFLTDAEITAKSQAEKTSGGGGGAGGANKPTARTGLSQYEQDMEYIRNWVANLPKPPPTKLFGEFKLDADTIMANAAREVAAANNNMK